MKRIAVLLSFAACASPPKTKPAAVPAPTAVPAPSVAPAALAAGAAATIPELTPEAFAVDGKYFDAVYAIDGATILTRDNVTGYVTADEKVEWIAKVPKETMLGGLSVGANRIYDVRGTYPDSIDVFYEALGRAPMPTYLPLTGKGSIFVTGSGGSWGNMRPARIGNSTLLAKWGHVDPYEIITVRGPALKRDFQRQSKCKPGEVGPMDTIGNATDEASPQVIPDSFEATASGRLVAIGNRCNQELVAEIWDPDKTTSRLVDLHLKGVASVGELHRGVGNDELWASTAPFGDVLHYLDGAWSFAPHLDRPIDALFMSPAHQVHVRTTDGFVFRLDGDAWTLVAHTTLDPKGRVWSTIVDANGAIWINAMPGASGTRAYRLRETSRVPATLTCANWFVYVVSARAVPEKWTYPTTQKALAGFPQLADVHLVEYGKPGGTIGMGVAVATREQGAAVVDYMGKSAPDLRPELVCFTPNPKRRDIPLAP